MRRISRGRPGIGALRYRNPVQFWVAEKLSVRWGGGSDIWARNIVKLCFRYKPINARGIHLLELAFSPKKVNTWKSHDGDLAMHFVIELSALGELWRLDCFNCRKLSLYFSPYEGAFKVSLRASEEIQPWEPNFRECMKCAVLQNVVAFCARIRLCRNYFDVVGAILAK